MFSCLIQENHIKTQLLLSRKRAIIQTLCMYVCMYVCMHACMYVCMYVCMHACMYISNATGMQLLQTYFLWVRHCFVCAMEPKPMELPPERRQRLVKLRAQQHRSSGSEERREHRREVHRQRAWPIQQQKSDNRRSQSLRLAKRSAKQHSATRFLRGPLHGIPCTHY